MRLWLVMQEDVVVDDHDILSVCAAHQPAVRHLLLLCVWATGVHAAVLTPAATCRQLTGVLQLLHGVLVPVGAWCWQALCLRGLLLLCSWLCYFVPLRMWNAVTAAADREHKVKT